MSSVSAKPGAAAPASAKGAASGDGRRLGRPVGHRRPGHQSGRPHGQVLVPPAQVEVAQGQAVGGVLHDDDPPALPVAAARREAGGVEQPGQHLVVDGLGMELAGGAGAAQRVDEVEVHGWPTVAADGRWVRVRVCRPARPSLSVPGGFVRGDRQRRCDAVACALAPAARRGAHGRWPLDGGPGRGRRRGRGRWASWPAATRRRPLWPRRWRPSGPPAWTRSASTCSSRVPRRSIAGELAAYVARAGGRRRRPRRRARRGGLGRRRLPRQGRRRAGGAARGGQLHLRDPRRSTSSAPCRPPAPLVLLTVTTPEEAGLALRAGPDALVLQGAEAGAHRGSLANADRPDEDRPVRALLAAVRRRTLVASGRGRRCGRPRRRGRPAGPGRGHGAGGHGVPALPRERRAGGFEGGPRRRVPYRRPRSPAPSAAGGPGRWSTPWCGSTREHPPPTPRSTTPPGPCGPPPPAPATRTT